MAMRGQQAQADTDMGKEKSAEEERSHCTASMEI